VSKKGSHGDGQHGKGTKGMKRPFDEVFATKSAQAKAKKRDSK